MNKCILKILVTAHMDIHIFIFKNTYNNINITIFIK